MLAIALVAGGAMFYFREGLFRGGNGYVPAQLRPFLQASRLELIALDPGALRPAQKQAGGNAEVQTPQPLCHGYPVLGAVTLASAADLEEIRAAIRDLDRSGRTWNGLIAGCFTPRHCIRLATSSGVSDLLICYECHGVKILEGSTADEQKVTGTIYMAGAAPAESGIVNAILTRHSIPLPKE
ncbi:hypothetical protein [Brevifollis gellanilyticus]|uniref:hypothetical protein n=1 Tax=Brevifollis gellanilyticus TaxID=748831 RepID=UPI001C3F66F1|nr:hypothetical protein [Brevifollis gellanilyticus]